MAETARSKSLGNYDKFVGFVITNKSLEEIEIIQKYLLKIYEASGSGVKPSRSQALRAALKIASEKIRKDSKQ